MLDQPSYFWFNMLEYMALNERGGELFKRGFRKLFHLEQNPLCESISEFQLAKNLSTKQSSTRKTIGCLCEIIGCLY